MPYPSSSASGVTPSSSAFARLIMITAAAPSEICDALPAVIVPSLENAGRRPPSDSGVVPGRTPSSVSTMTGSPLRCGIETGVISSAKRPSFCAAAARSWLFAASSSCCARVMSPRVGDVLLGAAAHVHRVERAPQAVVDHRVDDRVVAHAVAGARAGEDVRRTRHRLHAAGDDDLGVARRDHLVGEVDRVDARQADLVDGHRGHAHRDARVDRGLARGDLALAGLEHLAHEDVVDLLRADAGPLERGLDGNATEVHRGEVGERSRQLPDRRACRSDDHRAGHGASSRQYVVPLPVQVGQCRDGWFALATDR